MILGTMLYACATDVAATPSLKNAIAVSIKPIPLSPSHPELTRVGRLIWRGGIEISSPEGRFGGWSGLVVSRDGKRMLAQSDDAHWLRASLVYDRHGNLIGIQHAQLADMLDVHGRKMSKVGGDAEGLDAVTKAGPDGAVVVSFEQSPRIWRYDLSHSLDVRPTAVNIPKSVDVLDGSNLGLEGLTVLKPGTLLAVSEAPHDVEGRMDAWLVPYGSHVAADRYGELHVLRHPPYEISDAAMGPSGKHLYILERHYFGLIGGVVIAVREIDARDVKPGATLGGREIARFTMRENIDNMEGLALSQSADGKTFLYMISDDNYNPLQRTLLEMFELAPSKAQ
jgi:hypothetical protein